MAEKIRDSVCRMEVGHMALCDRALFARSAKKKWIVIQKGR